MKKIFLFVVTLSTMVFASNRLFAQYTNPRETVADTSKEVKKKVDLFSGKEFSVIMSGCLKEADCIFYYDDRANVNSQTVSIE